MNRHGIGVMVHPVDVTGGESERLTRAELVLYGGTSHHERLLGYMTFDDVDRTAGLVVVVIPGVARLRPAQKPRLRVVVAPERPIQAASSVPGLASTDGRVDGCTGSPGELGAFRRAQIMVARGQVSRDRSRDVLPGSQQRQTPERPVAARDQLCDHARLVLTAKAVTVWTPSAPWAIVAASRGDGSLSFDNTG